MAEEEPTQEQLTACVGEADDDESTTNPNYKPPAQKSLQEIQQLDQEDEKPAQVQGGAAGQEVKVVSDPNAPNIQVTRMTLVCDQAETPLVLDLTGDLMQFKQNPLVLKEGVEYKIKISFKVNKEIVSGLKYVQNIFRKGIKIDKSEYMVGSYGPRPDEEYDFFTTMEEAPKGMLARGAYNIKSKFTDDDKHDHLSWEWTLNIKKDWKD
ncbi:rho GDP-dissociation inhibitor 1-like [Plectropomus leopardus]|uniref:rho GDP-dissociation inhibitor 1-like n=1 Tax=Plectropomus leopardus TaxID=160734 RepID=UPI001C4DBC1D|nr:rho GDP-dissociation inhibitor 1-like [Plectropomus leopardus]